MLIFENITWRNFLSTGNAPTTFNLNGAKSTLVLGKNGSGKCVDKKTQIDIDFLDESTKLKFNEFLEKHKNLK